MHIFVSYSRKDSDLVSTLVEDLEALGHQVWFDRELVRVGGQNWWSNLLDNIRKCDLFVFALTPISLSSEACQREYHYAYSVNKRILPIMLTPVNILTLPQELQELQLLPYTERSKKQSLAIAASLSNLPPARPLPDPLPPHPEIPLSPLSQIVTTLNKPSLSASEQIELVFELEVLFANQTTRVGAQDLLQKLYERRDTTRSVADKIRAVMSSQQASIPAKREGRKVLPIMAVLVGVLVVLALGGFALKFLSGGTATPTANSPTKVAEAATEPTSSTDTAIIAPTAISSISGTAQLTDIPTVTTNNQWTPRIQSFNGVNMVLVPPGCFMMGLTDSQIADFNKQDNVTWWSDSGPQTKICFDKPFWIDQTDVTQAQFKRLGGQAAHSSYFPADSHPVEQITWPEARDYCEKQRNGGLPTEAQWEYAARGPDDLIYPWGNIFDTRKAIWNRGSQGTASVGTAPDGVSWVGALDMAGNVWQWTSTIYDQSKFPYPYKSDDGRENNSDTTSKRVLRGGSWDNAASYLRSADRSDYDPTVMSRNFGFRCVRTATISTSNSTPAVEATTSIPSTQAPTSIPTVSANNQWTPQTQAFGGVDMVLVPSGCFTLGTDNPPKGYENEQPTAHICFDKPFWIDKTEVTQAQFRQFGGQAATPSTFKGDNRPVEGITWFEATNFCTTKRGARLPTEAEWEYAARGPDDLIYPWGNDFVAANMVGINNSGGQTADVGSKPDGKSWVGALDMLGNVWEWTSTIYDPQRFPYPYNANDGREAKDDTKSWRVVRGGSWSNAPDILHSAIRANFLPTNSYNYFGFRCVRS